MTSPNERDAMMSEQELLDMALEDSFPASDPVSPANPSRGVKAARTRPDSGKSRRAILESLRDLLDLEFRPAPKPRR
ncbi:MAG TPA: hypothetical protein VL993_09735 [Stellaceae bacterium]|nr:hypothetical protein [Stellaceae bacterium]